jgi:glucosyl-3-phosphoglycerate synthase
MTEKFLRFVNSHPEFRPFLEKGLAAAILSVENKTRRGVFAMPQTVSWERVSNKLPRIFYDLIEVVEEEKRRFS